MAQSSDMGRIVVRATGFQEPRHDIASPENTRRDSHESGRRVSAYPKVYEAVLCLMGGQSVAPRQLRNHLPTRGRVRPRSSFQFYRRDVSGNSFKAGNESPDEGNLQLATQNKAHAKRERREKIRIELFTVSASENVDQCRDGGS